MNMPSGVPGNAIKTYLEKTLKEDGAEDGSIKE
jgi:hypothetical protein